MQDENAFIYFFTFYAHLEHVKNHMNVRAQNSPVQEGIPDVYTAVSLFIDWIQATASAHGGLATCTDTTETGGSATGQGKQGRHLN